MSDRLSLIAYAPNHDPRRASLSIDASHPAQRPISPLLYGKFCEHLGQNIYNGMHAQVLRNPTFGSWPFSLGETSSDGGCDVVMDPQQARKVVEHHNAWGLPDKEALIGAYANGAAFFWLPAGEKDAATLSGDVGPHGCRAQRVEVLRDGAGIRQWTHLPLHRTGGYEYRVVARSMDGCQLTLRISRANADGSTGPALVEAPLPVGREWTTLTGRLQLPADVPADALYELAVTASAGTNAVLARVLLYPNDHVGGADPDVIRLLRKAQLPILRWPGGNFVSGYHWRDGVGPADLRPTLPNMAWGGLEYNLFGTDEFIAFCRQVGCQPLICVNAGNGREQEAADWVEYCNGSADTPMGGLRAANGHPEPYNILYWEIGNELYGQWQIGRTTPAGNADRCRRFADAMRRADPNILLIACGDRAGSEWDRAVLRQVGPDLAAISSHPLAGGAVDDSVDPVDLYHAFMDYPRYQVDVYRQARRQMTQEGLAVPPTAVTELQLFARYRGTDPAYRLPTPATMSEALYCTLWFHECARAGDDIVMLTHSATVNHGGGLAKTRERVFPHPVHYAHAIGVLLAGARPVPVRLACGTVSTGGPTAALPATKDMPVLDAFAALAPDGVELFLSVVHRSAVTGAIDVKVEIPGFAGSSVEVTTLRGETFTDRNTAADPQRIVPVRSSVQMAGQTLELTVQPFCLVQVRVRKIKP